MSVIKCNECERYVDTDNELIYEVNNELVCEDCYLREEESKDVRDANSKTIKTST